MEIAEKNHPVDLLPAYALGALDPEDLSRVEAHLVQCPLCQEEARAYGAVVDLLPLSMPEVSPPADLKARLMQNLPEHPSASVRASAGATHKAETPSLWQSFLRSLRMSAPVWGLASLLMILFLVGNNLSLLRQLRSAQQPALQVINLHPSEAAPDATGLLVVSMDGEHGTLVVDRLPPLGENQQYQLWLIHDGQRTSGGLIDVSREGYGALWVKSPDPLISYTGYGITIEPAGGSPSPTGPRVLGSDQSP